MPRELAKTALRACLVIVACACCPGLASAQESPELLPTPLTREDCIAFALARHPAIKLQRAGAAAAYEQTRIARSYFLPDVGVGANYNYIDEPRSVDVNLFTGAVGDRLLDVATVFQIADDFGGAAAVAALDNLDSDQFNQAKQQVAAALPATLRADLLGRNFVTTQLRVIQPLWTGGKITARYEQAQAGSSIARYDVCQAQQGVAYNVSRAYFAVLLSEDLHQCALAAADYAWGVGEIADALVEQGDRYVTDADVLRAQTFASLYREQAVGLAVSVDRASAALRLAMGMSQLEGVAVADATLPTERYFLDREEMRLHALAHRPEMMKAGAAVRFASLGRDAAKAEYMPDVGAVASFSTINDDANFPNPNDPAEWAVGVGATMPIYRGGRNAAQVRQANDLICQAVETRNLAARVVEQEVIDACLELEEMDGRLTESAAAVNQAAQALESYNALSNLGIDAEQMPQHYENLLTTRLLLVTAQVRYFQALYGYNVALARVRLSAGMAPLTAFAPVSDDEDSLASSSVPVLSDDDASLR